MNQKQAKKLRQRLRAQGINPAQNWYDELPSLGRKYSPDADIFAFARVTRFCHPESGRGIYRAMKRDLKQPRSGN